MKRQDTCLSSTPFSLEKREKKKLRGVESRDLLKRWKREKKSRRNRVMILKAIFLEFDERREKRSVQEILLRILIPLEKERKDLYENLSTVTKREEKRDIRKIQKTLP